MPTTANRIFVSVTQKRATVGFLKSRQRMSIPFLNSGSCFFIVETLKTIFPPASNSIFNPPQNYFLKNPLFLLPLNQGFARFWRGQSPLVTYWKGLKRFCQCFLRYVVLPILKRNFPLAFAPRSVWSRETLGSVTGKTKCVKQEFEKKIFKLPY